MDSGVNLALSFIKFEFQKSKKRKVRNSSHYLNHFHLKHDLDESQKYAVSKYMLYPEFYQILRKENTLLVSNYRGLYLYELYMNPCLTKSITFDYSTQRKPLSSFPSVIQHMASSSNDNMLKLLARMKLAVSQGAIARSITSSQIVNAAADDWSASLLGKLYIKNPIQTVEFSDIKNEVLTMRKRHKPIQINSMGPNTFVFKLKSEES